MDLATTSCCHKSIAYYNIYSKISCWREGWTLWQSMMLIAWWYPTASYGAIWWVFAATILIRLEKFVVKVCQNGVGWLGGVMSYDVLYFINTSLQVHVSFKLNKRTWNKCAGIRSIIFMRSIISRILPICTFLFRICSLFAPLFRTIPKISSPCFVACHKPTVLNDGLMSLLTEDNSQVTCFLAILEQDSVIKVGDVSLN